MAKTMERQPTPLSAPESSTDSEPAVKKSRNRKVNRKPVPLTATLHGLWGKSTNSGDTQQTTSIDMCKTESELGTNLESGVKASLPLVFKIAPEKLLRVI